MEEEGELEKRSSEYMCPSSFEPTATATTRSSPAVVVAGSAGDSVQRASSCRRSARISDAKDQQAAFDELVRSDVF